MDRLWSLCGIYNEPSFPFFSNFRSLEAPQFNDGKGGGGGGAGGGGGEGGLF